MPGNTIRGRWGEDLATHYLQQSGYEILHRNWRFSRFEIDIIAAKNQLLHFIEVKTRSSLQFGFPEESVSAKKMTNLMKAGAQYQYQYPEWTKVQYDVLSILLQSGSAPAFYLLEDIYL